MGKNPQHKDPVVAMFIVAFICIFGSFVIVKKQGAFSPLSVYSIYNSACIVAYLIVIDFGRNSYIALRTVLPLQYVGQNATQVGFIYACAAVVSVIFGLWLGGGGRGERQAFGFHMVLDSLAGSRWALRVIAAIFVAWASLHALDIDWSKVWLNESYLELLDNRQVGIDTMPGELFQTSMRYVGTVSLALFVLSQRGKWHLEAGLFGLCSAYVLLMTVARASRFFPLFFEEYLVVDLVLSGGKWRLRHALAIAVAAVSFVIVMEQRNFHLQGLSQFPAAFLAAFSVDFLANAIGLFVNVFQSAAVLDNSLRFSADYPSVYKVLSISPLPSFIDNFSNIRSFYEIRITKFNPFNSFGEAYQFGWFYISLLEISLPLTFGIVGRLMKARGGIIFIPAALLCYLLIFSSGQYQLRTTTKMMTVTLVVLVATILFRPYLSGFRTGGSVRGTARASGLQLARGGNGQR